MTTQEIINLSNSISRMTDGCRFVSFTYKSKESGELARHTLLVGFSYHNLIKKSIEELSVILPTLTGDRLLAGNEVMTSFQKTLVAHKAGQQNEDYTKKGMYSSIRNGVNINLNDNTIQVFGLSQNKIVIEEGTYKVVNSRPMTILKKEIRDMLSISKFREYAFDPGVILSGKSNGETFNCP
jgi:hypothetical protein